MPSKSKPLLAGDKPKLLTIDEAAEFLRVSAKTVRKLGKAGALPIVRVTGRTQYVRQEALEEFLRTREAQTV